MARHVEKTDIASRAFQLQRHTISRSLRAIVQR
jgi:hypothetical protein